MIMHCENLVVIFCTLLSLVQTCEVWLWKFLTLILLVQLILNLTQPYNEISHKILVIVMTWFQLRVSKAVDFVMLCRVKRRIEFCTKCNSTYVILYKCRLIWWGDFCSGLVFSFLWLRIFLDKNVTAVVLALRTTSNNIEWHLNSLKAIIIESSFLVLLLPFFATW